MATIAWAADISGFYRDFTKWQGGQVPSATDTAVLAADGGAAYTVVSRSGLLGLALGGTQKVGAIQTASNATLQVVGDIDVIDLLAGDTKFAALSGTGGGVNAGTIVVQDAVLAIKVLGINHLLGATATLEIGSTFDNTGTISINGQPHLLGLLDSDQTANLEVVGNTVLTGGGAVTLSNERNNFIYGAFPTTAVLDNVNNTISGAGIIGGLTVINEAAGVIDANVSNALSLNSRKPLKNAGLLEASNHGTLVITKTTVANTGVIEAKDGSTVILQSTDVQGGTVESVGTGLVVANDTLNTLDGTASTVNVAGHLRIRGGSALTVEGVIHNTGQIALASLAVHPETTSLIIGAAGATLTGGGQIRMSDESDNRVIGATSTATLTNVDNTILAAGELGGGRLTLVNEAKGRILSISTVGLTIATGLNPIENDGRIFSLGTGGITIDSVLDNNLAIEALGGNLTVNAAVTGTGVAFIRGATLDFESTFSQNVAFIKNRTTGLTTGTLELDHSTSFTSKVGGFSKTGGTSLDLGDVAFNTKTKATYAGSKVGGVLTVTNGLSTAHIRMVGDYTGTTFAVASDGEGGTTVTGATTTTAAHLVAAMARMPAPSSTSSVPSHHSTTAPIFAAPSLHA